MVPLRQINWPDEQWWYYGGDGGASSSSLLNSQRFLKAWCWYFDGCIPYWDSLKQQEKWTTDSDPYAVFFSGEYVPGSGGVMYNGAIPSVRMKEMRRGQQDVEYLAYLANRVKGWNRAEVIHAMRDRYGDSNGKFSGMDDLNFSKMREDVDATIRAGSSVGADSPPVVHIIAPSDTLYANTDVSICCAAFDVDGDPLTYQWTQTGGDAVTLADVDTAIVSFTAPAVPKGKTAATVDLKLTVSDDMGYQATDSLEVSFVVRPNRAAHRADRFRPELMCTRG